MGWKNAATCSRAFCFNRANANPPDHSASPMFLALSCLYQSSTLLGEAGAKFDTTMKDWVVIGLGTSGDSPDVELQTCVTVEVGCASGLKVWLIASDINLHASYSSSCKRRNRTNLICAPRLPA